MKDLPFFIDSEVAELAEIALDLMLSCARGISPKILQRMDLERALYYANNGRKAGIRLDSTPFPA